MKPLVSFIVPFFNSEKTIRKCVDSILNQTYDEIELILIDDGSSDAGYEICRIVAENNPNINLIRQTNRGVAAARNVGLDVARGEYVSFVDADDYISPRFVEKMLSPETIDGDVVVCSCFAETHDGAVPQHFFPNSFDASVQHKCKQDIFYQLMDVNYTQKKPVYTGVGVPWGKMYKSSFLAENNIRFNEELNHYEDNLFILEIYYQTDRIIYLDQCLYHYSTSHISNVLHKYNEKIVNSYLKLFRLRRDLIDKNLADTDEQMTRQFKLASLNLFDVAVFTMTICLKNDSFLHKCKAVKEQVENTGYLDFFRDGIDDLQLTPKRKLLYRMLGLKLFFPAVLTTLIRYSRRFK